MLFRKCAASAAGLSFVLAAAISMLVLPRTANAVLPPGAFTFTIAPDGAGNVVVSGSGDVNTAGGTNTGSGAVSTEMNPGIAFILNGPTSASGDQYTFTTALTGPSNFGSNNLFTPTSSGSGDLVGMFYSPGVSLIIGVPTGYTADTPLTDTSTYTGATLASLGLTPGTSTWTEGTNNTANTINIIVSTTPVPEPATLSLLALGGTMLLRRRRRVF